MSSNIDLKESKLRTPDHLHPRNPFAEAFAGRIQRQTIQQRGKPVVVDLWNAQNELLDLKVIAKKAKNKTV